MGLAGYPLVYIYVGCMMLGNAGGMLGAEKRTIILATYHVDLHFSPQNAHEHLRQI